MAAPVCGPAAQLEPKVQAMSEVTIRTRPNGPFLIEGAFKLVDSAGNAFQLDPNKAYALCRCGQSSRKPFCDGTHKACGFMADERVPDPAAPTAT